MEKEYKQTTKVYDHLGKKYLQDSLKLVPAERTVFIKQFSKGAKILDVGCGGGRDSKVFANCGFDVTGIDLSGVMIKEAKKLVPKGKFLQMNVLDLAFDNEQFDGIWAQAILLHLIRKDVAKAFKELKRVLIKGGLLHVRVKHGIGHEYVKEKLSGWNERFYTYYLKSEMEALFKKSGFRIVYSELLDDELGRKDVKWIAIWGRKI